MTAPSLPLKISIMSMAGWYLFILGNQFEIPARLLPSPIAPFSEQEPFIKVGSLSLVAAELHSRSYS